MTRRSRSAAVRLLLALAACAACAALAGPANAAAAVTPRVLTCEFHLVPGDITPGIMLLGGMGTYTFGTPAGSATGLCSHTVGVAAPALVPSRIKSDGEFVNVVCGTGAARSPRPAAPTTATTVVVGAVPFTITYAADLTGLSGPLDVRTVNGHPDAAPTNGTLTFHPTRGDCAGPSGITGFAASIAFTASWSP